MTKTRGRRADSSVLSYIYVLIDPVTLLPRYVGKTSKDLRVRLGQHLTRAARGGHSHRDAWIRKLGAEGQIPRIEAIEQGYWDVEEADHREIHWIELLRAQGARLTNMTDGGDGQKGHTVGPDVRAQVSAAMKKHWADPEYRERLLAARQAADSPEYRAKVGAASEARWADPEHRKKLLETRQAAWDRDREKRSAALAETTRRRWADPDAPMRKTMQSAEYRARRSVISKEIASRPEAKAHRARAGAKSSKMRRRCVECGLVSSPGPMGSHLRASGHSGFQSIETEGGE